MSLGVNYLDMGDSDGKEFPLANNQTESEKAKHKSFGELRDWVRRQQRNETKERLQKRPEYTEEERMMGLYFEEIERQVRAVVVDLNRKGYRTESSGFGGADGEEQVIEGSFKLEKKVAEELAKIGVSASTKPSWKLAVDRHLGHDTSRVPEDLKYSTRISFFPEEPNLEMIEKKWNEAAELFPDKGHFSTPYEHYSQA
jgi:hypothetical protein